jgi:hypothetical protein
MLRRVQAPLATPAELGRAHDAGYVRRCLGGQLSAAEQRAVGLPWTPSLATYAQ